MVDDSPTMPRLAARPAVSHKGDYGRALLIGGSRGMSGAIALTGLGALYSGAGLVTLAVPDRCLETVAALHPSYMTLPLPCDAEGRMTREAWSQLGALAARASAGACGPGLGRSDELQDLVRTLYTDVKIPLVFDADALNALSEHPAGLTAHGGPRILTPHPGEMDRLFNLAAVGDEERCARAIAAAAEYSVVIVLKGHRTLVTDGTRNVRNQTGNPGMATGGAGDVLTGIITALLCQGLEAWDAARLGVHVHGLAGDHAARKFGQVAMTSREIAHCLANAWQEVQQ